MSNFIEENIHTLKMPTNATCAARVFGLGDSNYQTQFFSGDAHGGFVKVEKEINSDRTKSIQIRIALGECKTIERSQDLLRAFIGGLGAGSKSEDWLCELVKYAKKSGPCTSKPYFRTDMFNLSSHLGSSLDNS